MVAFQFAAQHPELVGRLVLASMPFASEGFYADIQEQQKRINPAGLMSTPLYDAYKEFTTSHLTRPRVALTEPLWA
jgi:pimeloyl-ACP methyl ester carboxylesterase